LALLAEQTILALMKALLLMELMEAHLFMAQVQAHLILEVIKEHKPFALLGAQKILPGFINQTGFWRICQRTHF